MEKKKLTKEEQMVKDAWEFVNCQVNAIKQRGKKFTSLVGEDIGIYKNDKEVHMHGLIRLSELVSIPYNRTDWSGNETCETNHDEVYFLYKGVRFFQLVDKIGEEENNESISD